MSRCRVVACVDDFGLTPAIDAAVATLAERGAITATSCLVNSPGICADSLRQVMQAGIDVGLHLNFTEGRPLAEPLRGFWPSFPTLPRLMALAHARLLPFDAVASECRSQLAMFRDLAGRYPDFIDGHQHVHHLPIIRDGWLAAVGEAGISPYVRDTSRIVGPGFALKRMLIRRSGAVQLRHQLRTAGLPTVGPLVGAYDFSGGDYGARVRRWLATATAGHGQPCSCSATRPIHQRPTRRRTPSPRLGCASGATSRHPSGLRTCAQWVPNSRAGAIVSMRRPWRR